MILLAPLDAAAIRVRGNPDEIPNLGSRPRNRLAAAGRLEVGVPMGLAAQGTGLRWEGWLARRCYELSRLPLAAGFFAFLRLPYSHRRRGLGALVGTYTRAHWRIRADALRSRKTGADTSSPLPTIEKARRHSRPPFWAGVYRFQSARVITWRDEFCEPAGTAQVRRARAAPVLAPGRVHL